MASNKLNEILARFAAEIETLVRDDVTAKVLGSLTGEALVHRGASRKIGGSRALARKGAKRSPEEIEQLTKKLHSYVSKNPGQRIEQIGEGMNVATKELVLAVKKLINAGRLTTKGQKRATSYRAK